MGHVHTGQVAYHSGLSAERCVADRYQRQGYEVLHHRWRGAAGEIDLITRRDDVIVFVEVKHARTLDAAAQRLSQRQVARILQSADEFLGAQPNGTLSDARIDVALVDRMGACRVLENAVFG
ncbi:MAG: YraN family protein [Pseudomonadota bacterium]